MTSRFILIASTILGAAACGGRTTLLVSRGGGATVSATGGAPGQGSGGAPGQGAGGSAPAATTSATGGMPAADAGGTGGTGGDSGAQGCTQDGDCAQGQECSYAIAQGCAAQGTCVDRPPLSKCITAFQETGCGCDGQDVHWTYECAASEPTGYAPAPIAHLGSCATSGCTTSSDCGAGQVCGFPVDGGCGAMGQCVPVADVMPICNSNEQGCTCAGQTVLIACGAPDWTVPLAHTGGC